MNNLETNLKPRKPRKEPKDTKKNPMEMLELKNKITLRKSLVDMGSAAEWKRERKQSVY